MLTIRISAVGSPFGRATSLGDRRLLCLDRKFTRAIGRHFLTIRISAVGSPRGRATSLGDRRLLWPWHSAYAPLAVVFVHGDFDPS